MNTMSSTNLVTPHERDVVRMCGYRDQILRELGVAAEQIRAGHAAADAAMRLLPEALQFNGNVGQEYYRVDRRNDSDFVHLRSGIDPAKALDVARQHVDASFWNFLMSATGFYDLMDAQARQAFSAQLASSDIAPFTEDNVMATFEGLRDKASDTFLGGIARVFAALDSRFKSHDAFQFEDRVILTHVFDEWGVTYSSSLDYIADIERTFRLLDGEDARTDSLMAAVRDARRTQGLPLLVHTSYFRLRGFKNGNAHLWFTRKDLVEQVNKLLAEYYGAVLPDAVPHPDKKVKSTALAPDLQFYPTPPKVAQKMVAEAYVNKEGIRVLEPSAGEGALITALLAKAPHAEVVAVEVDSRRAASLSRQFPQANVTVLPTNFLTLPARPAFDCVLMNPPFYGTHWMDHVLHAYEFLAPRGYLVAVLPVTAEVGSTKSHQEFRAWVDAKNRGMGSARFSSLPSRSFASSGTNIETVLLTIRREW